MLEATLPTCEAERLAQLLSFQVLDTEPEQSFDDLTHMASVICATPIALDSERQWFKSHRGPAATETPRRVAFCSHAILRPHEVFMVPDARQDPRFADNPLVTGPPHVIFYAGAPIVTPEGLALGTLCVIDHRPRQLDTQQLMMLRTLADQVMAQLELRRKCLELQDLSGKLVEANIELQDFTSFAAHDLHEPLNNLVSLGELMRHDLGDNPGPRMLENLSMMVSSARRMKQLISDLLELSRTSSRELDFERVELDGCVATVRQRLSSRIEKTGAVITCDPLPAVQGDETLLTQMLQNLVANALKFVADGTPRVHVTCERDGARTIFGVRDNGIGIAADQVERIFKPFRRLHGRGEYEGSGIGLTVARKAVLRHGGELWVESEPDRGSHFRFTLPGVPGGSPLPTAGQAARPSPA